MTDWRTDEQIEQDRQDEPRLRIEFAILLISLVVLLLHSIGFVG